MQKNLPPLNEEGAFLEVFLLVFPKTAKLLRRDKQKVRIIGYVIPLFDCTKQMIVRPDEVGNNDLDSPQRPATYSRD